MHGASKGELWCCQSSSAVAADEGQGGVFEERLRLHGVALTVDVNVPNGFRGKDLRRAAEYIRSLHDGAWGFGKMIH